VLWAGMYGGLIRFHKPTETLTLHFFPFEDKNEQITRNAFRRILPHMDGFVYTGAWGAVWQRFDPSTGRLTALPVRPDNDPDLVMMNVRRLISDVLGRIWITAGNGLFVYDPAD